MKNEEHWWDTVPVERQHYREYNRNTKPNKAEKIANALWKISRLKEQMRPQKKLDRGIVIAGAKQPT